MRLLARQTTRVGFIRRLGRSPCEAISDIPCEFSIEHLDPTEWPPFGP